MGLQISAAIAASVLLGASNFMVSTVEAQVFRNQNVIDRQCGGQVASSPESTRAGIGARTISPGKQITFEKNQGQGNSGVRFISRAPGGMFALTDRGAIIQVAERVESKRPDASPQYRVSNVGLSFPGSRSGTKPVGGGLAETRSHYFRGNDQTKWISNVPHYTSVRYPSIYDGIDLVYYGSEGQLEYDFVVAPGARPERIRMRFDGGKATLQGDGNLLVKTSTGLFTQLAPSVYQEHGGAKKYVDARYVKKGRDFAVAVGQYDRKSPLVIDPVIHYSTYLGGSGTEETNGVALVLSTGMVVVGETTSSDFPTTSSAADPTFGGVGEAFVMQFNQNGTLAWSTFLGGSLYDRALAVAVDYSTRIWVVGSTTSTDFPTTDASNPHWGQSDAFVTQLSSSGVIIRSKKFGGTLLDVAASVAIAPTGHAYVAGHTTSVGAFGNTAGAFDPSQNGGYDGFVMKLSSDASLIVWSTYIGGSADDFITDVASDGSSNAYVTGETLSSNLPVAGGFDTSYGGNADAFALKLTSAGGFSYGTYLGGSGEEEGHSIDTTSNGIAYIGGLTSSSDFPVSNALIPARRGVYDGFVTALNSTGTALLHSTFFGGSSNDHVRSLDVSDDGRILVGGSTLSADFPVANPIDSALSGVSDGFVALLRPNPKEGLLFSTFVGGSGTDRVNSVELGFIYSAGKPVVPRLAFGGWTESTDYPAPSIFYGGFLNPAFQSTLKGTRDGSATYVVFGYFDPNGDTTVSVADVFYLVNFLFAGGTPPPAGGGDANGDGSVTVADVFFTVNYLFAGGPYPG